jgi:hypothetical protein
MTPHDEKPIRRIERIKAGERFVADAPPEAAAAAPQKPKAESATRGVEIAAKTVAVVTALLAALWTYMQIEDRLADRYTQVLDITALPAVTKIEDGKLVLILDINLKNRGKAPIRPSRQGDERGLMLWVTEFEDPTVAEEGTGVVTGVSGGGGGELKRPIWNYNILETYASYQSGEYVIGSGVEWHESIMFPITEGKLYGINVRFYCDRGWSTCDVRYVLARPKG